ncbi:MAG: glycosyltransferase family 2 protein [Planctomycetaceae bacterium]|nr:glycosyltransferase family 2 protein [Planctomycetaceae bacterium]
MILTRNEAATIESCLKFLDWADDVILIDYFSTDDTIVRAKVARPDLRIFQHAFLDFGDQRNWALDETSPRHSWVLFLDADEHCNAECARGIRDAVEHPGENVGFYLTCRNMFLGRWIKRCSLYPTWQLRLLKRGEVRYRKEGHGQREIADGPLGYLDAPYDHYGFSHGVAHWVARHNRYSTDEVELVHRLRQEPLALQDLISLDPIRRRRCLKRMAARFGCRPLARFVYLYFIRRGFLDGRAGFHFCLLRVAHEIHITVKLAEAREGQGDAATSSPPGRGVEDPPTQLPPQELLPSSRQRAAAISE